MLAKYAKTTDFCQQARKVGALLESQSGGVSGSWSVLPATSAGAGSGRAGLGRSSGVWEISLGSSGCVLGPWVCFYNVRSYNP